MLILNRRNENLLYELIKKNFEYKKRIEKPNGIMTNEIDYIIINDKPIGADIAVINQFNIVLT